MYCLYELSYYKGSLRLTLERNERKEVKSLIKYPPEKECEIFTIDNNVTILASCAFKNAKYIKEIVLHKGILCLGKELTFAECDSLRSITIPPYVSTIPKLAFYGCSSLEEVYLPETEKLTIEEDAFKWCNALKKIYALTDNADNISIGGAFDATTFEKCILSIPPGSRWSYKHHKVFGRFKNIEIGKRNNKIIE